MLLTRVKLRARASRPDAEEAAADVARLLRHMVPHPWMALLADVVLGEGAIDRADAAAAGRHAASAAALLDRQPDAGILRHRTEKLLEAVDRTRLAEPLTPAERRVLDLLPTHLTDAQMAEQLYVSRNTVKSHVKSLYRKLEVSSRADAVARAREMGLLSGIDAAPFTGADDGEHSGRASVHPVGPGLPRRREVLPRLRGPDLAAGCSPGGAQDGDHAVLRPGGLHRDGRAGPEDVDAL